MATPPNGISPLHMLRAEIEQMRSAGRNLTQEVLRLQRSEIQLAAVVKALIGGPGMEKLLPVDVVNATLPAGLHLSVEEGMVIIQCTAPKPAEAQPADSAGAGGQGSDVAEGHAGGGVPEPHTESAPAHTPPPPTRILMP